MGVIFFFLAAQVGITSLFEERRTGTLARMLAGPVSAEAVVLGKAIGGGGAGGGAGGGGGDGGRGGCDDRGPRRGLGGPRRGRPRRAGGGHLGDRRRDARR